LHTILGLIKIFFKALDQNSAGFMYLRNKFPRKIDAYIREGVFFAPQMRELIQDVNFKGQLNAVGKTAWIF